MRLAASAFGLILLVLAGGTVPPAHAQTHTLTAAHGLQLYQLSYPGLTGGSHTATGTLALDLVRLRATTGLDAGYLNLATPSGWLVRNLPIPSETLYPYGQLQRDLRLDATAGQPLASQAVAVQYSATPQASFATPATLLLPVAPRDVVAGGAGDTAATSAPPPPEVPAGSTAPTAPTPQDRMVVQLDHPNIETARNQCMPMSVANSLQYLKDRYGLPVPHTHQPGLRGDDSLVGQLDTAMDRAASSRTVGSGTWGLNGKLKYLAANGLAGRVETSHWGVGGPNEPNDTHVSVTEGGSTARSTGRGALNFDQILNALDEGQDCEMVFQWPGGGRHAVDLVAGGISQGQRWVTHASDMNQLNDSAGAGLENFQQENLGTDWKLSPSGATVEQVICQKALPAPATVTVTETIDPAGHSCCVDMPPSQWWFQWLGGQWQARAASGSASWLPLSGTVGAGGQFTLGSTATVAGFGGVRSTLTGTLSSEPFTAQLTVGTQGELFGTPIRWNLRVSGAAGVARPMLRANGMRHALSARAGQPQRLALGIDAGGWVGRNADLFLLAQNPQGAVLYLQADGQWGVLDITRGSVPATVTAPLASVDNLLLPLALTNGPDGLPPGVWRFYFGIDSTANGQLDLGSLVYEVLELTVR